MSKEQKVREVIAKHEGFTPSRRISGHVIDCNGCHWRYFTTQPENADKMHAQHVKDEIARLNL